MARPKRDDKESNALQLMGLCERLGPMPFELRSKWPAADEYLNEAGALDCRFRVENMLTCTNVSSKNTQIDIHEPSCREGYSDWF